MGTKERIGMTVGLVWWKNHPAMGTASSGLSLLEIFVALVLDDLDFLMPLEVDFVWFWYLWNAVLCHDLLVWNMVMVSSVKPMALKPMIFPNIQSGKKVIPFVATW